MSIQVAAQAPRARRRRRRRRIAVPGPAKRHLLSRFSYGVTPALVREMRRAGGTPRWFNRQLRPGRIRDGRAAGMRDWFPVMDLDYRQLWRRHDSGEQAGHQIMADYVRWTLLRRAYSRRQVHEVMTEFWSNLLHVPAHGRSWPHRISYDATIRRHALGRFDRLLTAAVTHPAMGLYLDNDRSTKDSPNENLGREVLELHTVGRGGHLYTEDDVKNSALILTGWRVDAFDTWKAWYDAPSHYVGRVQVMGFSHGNTRADGREVSRRYLRYLAHHPATARRIAERLVMHFVCEDPPAGLVKHVAEAYLRHDTDIRATLRALVNHPAFTRQAENKVRTPAQDLVATLRVLDIEPRRPSRRDSDLANTIVWLATSMGEQPFSWPTPDGPPLANDAWASVSRMLGSWKAHVGLAGGYWPSTGMEIHRPIDWMPRLPASYGFIVDHVSRKLLSRPASDALIDAACLALDIPRRERITRDHRLVRVHMPRLLQTVLDTPQHMSR